MNTIRKENVTQELRMPKFARVGWVSSQMEEKYKFQFARAKDIFNDISLNVMINGLTEISIQSNKKEIGINKKIFHLPVIEIIDKLKMSLCEISEVVCLPVNNNSVFCANKRTSLSNFLEMIAYKDNISIGVSLGVPSCCIKLNQKYVNGEIIDPIWEIIRSSIHERDYRKLKKRKLNSFIQINIEPELNFFLKRFHIGLLPHYPHSIRCEKSKKITNNIVDVILKNKNYDEGKEMIEILHWPILWSAFHGIALIYTPVCRLAYDSIPLNIKFSAYINFKKEGEKINTIFEFPFRA